MRNLRAMGMSNAEIAQRCNVTYGCVWLRIGGRRRKPHRSPVTVQDVASLRAKGLSYARCALLLGCSERTARKRLGCP